MLQKMTNPNRKDWSRLLEDSLWAHKTAYRTLLGSLPTGLSSVRPTTFPWNLSTKLTWLSSSAIWPMTRRGSNENFNYKNLMNSRIYKQNILRKDFHVGQKVLVFNSQLKLIACKLRSRWDGPFVITNIFPNGAVQLQDEHSSSTFQVNEHQIKPFHEGPEPTTADMEIISLMEPTPSDAIQAESVTALALCHLGWIRSDFSLAGFQFRHFKAESVQYPLKARKYNGRKE
ncbi:hypothetical protein CR513_10659, partial [Mucuna pruriens]